jgi:peptidoglycan hydrolase CwlO-like protein
MQLEKATSANSEAGLAGWISSNDVTLFTMVLVVIVAMFLHGKLARGKSEIKDLDTMNETLTGERNALDERRSALAIKLDASQKTLEELEGTRGRLDDERNKLERVVASLENDLQNSQEKIAAIKAKAGESEEDYQKRIDALEKVQAVLSQEVTTLVADKTNLKGEKKTLDERVADLATKLENRVKVLGELEKERARLKGQADKLDAIVATLERKLTDSGAEISALTTEAGESESAYQKRIAALEKVAGNETKRADDYLARLRRAADLFQGLKKSNANLTDKLDGAEQRYQRQMTRETTVNRKLVGINGKLKRVAMLFDASGSMKQKNADNSVGDRWHDAQDIASTWLGHLEVDECVLIVFSSDVRTFPNDGTMSKIQGPDGEANRAELMRQLKSVEPEGWTNTLEALEKAYEYDGIDTILLFSDGAPTFPNSGRFDPNVAQQIYTLCRKNPGVPINTVGLGNYFDKNLSTFLRTVANITGGTFRGR